jgi:hypothetical protein
MIFNRDESGGRCERCGVLVCSWSAVTGTRTPPQYRDDFDPVQVVTRRQCQRCHANRCAATLRHVAKRCARPRMQGSAVCEVCEKTIQNVMEITLQKYGIDLSCS